MKSTPLNTQCLRCSRTLKITTNDNNNIDVDIEVEGSFCNFSGSVFSCRSKEKEVVYFYLELIKNYYYFLIISNGNRTEWSPIRSVIIRVITKSQRSGSPICLSQVWLQTELDDTKSYCQLIIKITISEKRKIAKLCDKGKFYIKKLTKDA